MKILITTGSKHGATEEIGRAIGEALAGAGLQVETVVPDGVASLDGYDAVVIGSGVYAGRWVEPARRFVDEHQEALRERPVWVFSSGPIGEPPKPVEDPPDGVAMAARIGAREHRVFAGRLERDRLGFGERAIVGLLKAPDGDFRDWDAIRDWAGSIAAALRS